MLQAPLYIVAFVLIIYTLHVIHLFPWVVSTYSNHWPTSALQCQCQLSKFWDNIKVVFLICSNFDWYYIEKPREKSSQVHCFKTKIVEPNLSPRVTQLSMASRVDYALQLPFCELQFLNSICFLILDVILIYVPLLLIHSGYLISVPFILLVWSIVFSNLCNPCIFKTLVEEWGAHSHDVSLIRSMLFYVHLFIPIVVLPNFVSQRVPRFLQLYLI